MGRKKRTTEFVELDIESIAFKGGAVAKKDDLVYFVKPAVPGDKVLAKVLKKKKNFCEAQVEKILEPSKDRITPRCKHFGPCGGCTFQNLDYEKQLYWKTKVVTDSFERLARIDFGTVHDPLKSPKVFNYRNKMEFSFSWSRWLTDAEIATKEDIPNKHFALGLHISGRFDKVLDIEECHIHHEMCNEIIKVIKDKALESGIRTYNQRKHKGFLRNLVFRYSEHEDELMIILVTNAIEDQESGDFVKWFGEEIPQKFEKVTNVIHSVNTRFAQVAFGECEVLSGTGYITERILGIDFRISPYSFFQTNSSQLNQFVSKIVETADVKKDDVVWDLYCGAGSITLPLAEKSAKVCGIEISQNSIDDAKSNAKRNKIENVKFVCSDLHSKDTSELMNRLPQPEVIVIDPPRNGIHKNLLSHLVGIYPKRIVYVSCNPTTQARDCEQLSEYYDVKSLQPVDMFPHTYHIECIALLERKK